MKKSRLLGSEEGYFKLIAVTLIIVGCFYVGIKFGMPYYRYSAFKSDVREMARVSLGDANKTRSEVLHRAKELKIPIEDADLSISVKERENLVRIQTSWSETVDLMGLYQKTLDFDIDIEA